MARRSRARASPPHSPVVASDLSSSEVFPSCSSISSSYNDDLSPNAKRQRILALMSTAECKEQQVNMVDDADDSEPKPDHDIGGGEQQVNMVDVVGDSESEPDIGGSQKEVNMADEGLYAPDSYSEPDPEPEPYNGGSEKETGKAASGPYSISEPDMGCSQKESNMVNAGLYVSDTGSEPDIRGRGKETDKTNKELYVSDSESEPYIRGRWKESHKANKELYVSDSESESEPNIEGNGRETDNPNEGSIASGSYSGPKLDIGCSENNISNVNEGLAPTRIPTMHYTAHDEILILEGMLNFNEYGKMNGVDNFHGFIENNLSCKISSRQLSSKLSKLKKKCISLAYVPTKELSTHEKNLLDLGKKIWDEVKKGKHTERSKDILEKYPLLVATVLESKSKLAMEYAEMLSPRKMRVLEKNLRKRKVAETKHNFSMLEFNKAYCNWVMENVN